jgi:prepilin-type N-terminal cleavage/methylation domain-containing protein
MKNLKKINKKGFTLAEVVTAIGILVIIVAFTSVIFKSSIEAYRAAGANAEIIQKLQTITTQLDRDFSQVRKDGRLIISSGNETRKVSKNSSQNINVRMDRLYYFTTGDFQATNFPQIRNNVARIFLGHDRDSLMDANGVYFLDKCRLARDVLIFTPESSTLEDMLGAPFTYSSYAANSDANFINIISTSVDTSVAINNIGNARRVFTENVGEFKIEWSLGGKFRQGYYSIIPGLTIDNTISDTLVWYTGGSAWSPLGVLPWPKALKFTFTLYDSKEIIKGGRTFTHIVYLGD